MSVTGKNLAYNSQLHIRWKELFAPILNVVQLVHKNKIFLQIIVNVVQFFQKYTFTLAHSFSPAIGKLVQFFHKIQFFLHLLEK
jgi:hypothetical protein